MRECRGSRSDACTFSDKKKTEEEWKKKRNVEDSMVRITRRWMQQGHGKEDMSSVDMWMEMRLQRQTLSSFSQMNPIRVSTCCKQWTKRPHLLVILFAVHTNQNQDDRLHLPHETINWCSTYVQVRPSPSRAAHRALAADGHAQYRDPGLQIGTARER